MRWPAPEHAALLAFHTDSSREEILAWKVRYTCRSWAQGKHRPVCGWPESRIFFFLTEGGVSDWKTPGGKDLCFQTFLRWELWPLSPVAVGIIPLQSCLFSLLPVRKHYLILCHLGWREMTQLMLRNFTHFSGFFKNRLLLEDDIWFPGCCRWERRTRSFSINSLKTSPFRSL